jgi:rsbT co-antagonist protein RsbR
MEMNVRPVSGGIARLQADAENLRRDWLARQKSASTYRPDLIKEAELTEQSGRFLGLFLGAAQRAVSDEIGGDDWAEVRGMLDDLSISRARLGFSPSETATFVFSLKAPIFSALGAKPGADGAGSDGAVWALSALIDNLGLYTTEVYQKEREEVIARQQRELMELSTPVVQLWDDILALPLVGTLDSARAQVVMETLLQRVVDTGASIAILDITGVPTVDTVVAQHLMKTAAATRLMGADCIISGIRPQIAQTIVHLGVDLGGIVTKATLADAFALALKRTGARVAARPT